MERKTFVRAFIHSDSPDFTSLDVELGEFYSVWKEGVSIGSDPGCTLALPGLPPVAARVIAGSSHRFLYRLPEGASLPLPPPSYTQGGERVDEQVFELGPYLICIKLVLPGDKPIEPGQFPFRRV